VVACQSDDTAYPANLSNDAGSDATIEGGVGDGGVDSGAPDGAQEGGPGAEWLLLSYNGQSSSELVAFNVGAKAVDGRLVYPGFIGTTSTQSPDPYLMEQSADIVAKLDRAEPWLERSSWGVGLTDGVDGGYSDPNAVIVSTGTKAYVLRYTRNEIAVLDTSQVADAGAPTGTINLAGLVQANDTDGVVEMTTGIYVPSKQRVYVVLGNIDTSNVIDNGAVLLCSGTVSTVIAIDPATDSLVPLGDGGPGGALGLLGTNPVPGGLAYDSTTDRLLVVQAGCNQPNDGGAGPLVQREVEALSLGTGASTQLLDATQQGFPSAFVYIDATHAVLQFDFTGTETYAWNPTTPTLGALIPNAPDYFDYDGIGNLVGVKQTVLQDGGAGPIDVVSVPLAGGNPTTLGSNPFTLAPPAFVSGAALWPPTH
jgi:hypothetical protein